VRSFAVRLVLPPGWYEMSRDDPDAWITEVLDSAVPSADDEQQDAVADELIDVTYLDDVTGSVTTLVHVPDAVPELRALQLVVPTRRRTWLRRGPGAFAVPLRRSMARTGTAVEWTETELAGSPAVRLRGTATDELGRLTEQVLHVVVLPGAPGAVVLRVQWPSGRAEADELAAAADLIARGALVELL
jgi:hypothetical protein